MKALDIMTKNVVAMEDTATISEAIGRMREHNIHTVLVEKEGKYFGILTYGEILRRRSVQPNAKLVHFAVQSPGIEPREDLMDVARRFRESGQVALPVLHKDKIVGIISRTDLVAHLSDLTNIPSLTCAEVMYRDPECVEGTDGVDIAIEKMRTINASEIPVCDNSRKYLGIVRMDDASRGKVRPKEKEKFGQFAGSKTPITITCESIMVTAEGAKEKDLLTEVASKIVRMRVHLLPVVDAENKLVGVIRTNDIVDLIVDHEAKEGILVNISGLDPGDEDLYDITYFLADKFITRFHRLTNKRSGVLNVNVAKYKAEGEGKTKYSIRTRLYSGKISMSFDSYDWNYAKCISEIFEGYEKRLKKMRGKD